MRFDNEVSIETYIVLFLEWLNTDCLSIIVNTFDFIVYGNGTLMSG